MNGDREYLDFELNIGEGQGNLYPVIVLRSPVGETRSLLTFPFTKLELQNHLLALQVALLRSGGRRRRLSEEERTVRAFGQALFEILMGGVVGTLYYASLREAARMDRGVRIKLRIDPPFLAALPWEFLYDPLHKEFVCLSSHTPLVRAPAVAQPPLPLIVTPPLRILGMVANPHDLEDLNVALEKHRVEMALADLRAAGLVELVWLAGQSWRDLQRALRQGIWHGFHFIGHGGYDPEQEEGLLMLANSRGEARPLHATELGRLLANHGFLRLVVLNACEGARSNKLDVFSSAAGTLVQRGIPAVVAMQYEITDRAAIEFVRSFYEALADGLPVDTAVTEARVAVSLAVRHTLEWGVPVLYMRAPDGHIFAIRKSAEIYSPIELSAPSNENRLAKSSDAPLLRDSDYRHEPGTEEETVEDIDPGIEWVFIPRGEFIMGSDKEQDPMAEEDELPQHRLNVPAFHITRTPVTNAQYKVFVDATGHRLPPHWPAGDLPPGAEKHPVVHISWYDGCAYCAWLSNLLGCDCRLPTEAEWEKAARGTDGRIYPWGNELPDESRCNFDDLIGKTSDVTAYLKGSSPYGVLDMAGNVDEWTATLYWEYPYHVANGRENPEIDQGRVLRGGSFSDPAYEVRCTARGSNFAAGREDFIGFRVVISTSSEEN
jgi:formylglycine-generating enzyme required for sulfatase activity